MLPHLQSNVEANLLTADGATRVGAGTASFAAHRYGADPASTGLRPPYDFVIGADVQCDKEENVPLLAASIRSLSGPRTVACIITQARLGAHLAFHARLRAMFRRVKHVRARELRRAMAADGMEELSRAESLVMVVCTGLRDEPAGARGEGRCEPDTAGI